MTRIAVFAGTFLLAFVACAESRSGSIAGTVSDSDGVVADATVQAKNVANGNVYSTTTDTDGYTLSDVPAGTYEISVPPLGWRTLRYVQSGVVIEAGQALRLDIRLQKGNLGTVGDDGAYLNIRNKYAGLTGSVPRTADGKPDLSGVWQANLDPNPELPDAFPAAARLAKERLANDYRDEPAASCLPDPIPITTNPTLYKFVQTPSLLVQMFEYQAQVRQVFLGQSRHRSNLDPTWQGESIGRWDGDTLVVDTIGFNDKSWLRDGYPHSEKLHVIERYRRPDLAHLNVDITMEDPETLRTPWTLHMVWNLAPGERIMEYICNEDNKYHENTTAE